MRYNLCHLHELNLTYLVEDLQSSLPGFDFKAYSVSIVDGGQRELTTITIEQGDRETVQILLHPGEWKSQAARISTFTITQNELNAALEERGPKRNGRWNMFTLLDRWKKDSRHSRLAYRLDYIPSFWALREMQESSIQNRWRAMLLNV